MDWINLTGIKKVHSLIDKVYKRKNLEMAWEKVKANRGSGGVDGQNLEAFEAQLNQQLERLQRELKEDTYQPLPVRQHPIPKRDKPGEYRVLGIPTIYDRVCQQALLNRLEPIFEPIFADASFGYRRGRSTKDALRKVGREIQGGSEWIVDADLRDFFGSVDHEKLLTLLAQRVADGRVLRLIKAMLKAGSYGEGRLFPAERGTPQGSVVTPRTQKINLNLSGRSSLRGGSGIANDTPSSLDVCLLRLYLYVVCLAPLLLNGRSASIDPEPCFSFVHHSPKPFNSSSDRAPFLHVRLTDISSRPNA